MDGDAVIPGSTRILRYLEEKWPDPPLFPGDAARRAELDAFLDWFNEVWKVAPNAMEAELERESPDQEAVSAHSASMRAPLDRFESLRDGRDHLFGDHFSAADCIAFPFLKYAAGLRDPADDELFHRILEEHLERVSERPRA